MRFTIPLAVIGLLLGGCAPKGPSGIYTGYVDVSGDRIKITMDFRTDNRVFSYAEQVATKNPEKKPEEKLLSMLTGDDDGLRYMVVPMLVKTFKISDGRWNATRSGVEVFEDAASKEKKLSLKIEPDGDITSELLRLSKRPGIEPVAMLDVKDFKDKKPNQAPEPTAPSGRGSP